MATRKVGFGQDDDAPTPRRAILWRVALAIGVLLGAGAWIAAGLGLLGADEGPGPLGSVASGQSSVADLLGVLAPPLLIAVGALYFLFQDVRLPKPTPEPRLQPERSGHAASQTDRSQTDRDQTDRSDAAPGRRRGNRVGVAFLGLWLTGWSAGMAVAANALLAELARGELGPALFLAIWLCAATIGWFLAVRQIRRMIRGDGEER